MDKLKNRKLYFSIFIIIVLTIFIARTLFTNALPRTDDIELHATRLANYYLAIKQKQIPPYWGPNLNHGFGYPIFLFSYHLPYLIAVIFFAIGLGIELSINLTIVFFLLIGGLGIFYLSRLYRKNNFQAILSSLIYMTAPYMLLNVFVRGALGEISFLGTLPWVFVIIKIRQKSHLWWYKIFAVIFFSALILSHPPSMIVTMPLLIFWIVSEGFLNELKNWKKNKYLINFLLTVVLSIGLTSFFWIPFLWEKKYTVIDNHNIVSNFEHRYLPAEQLIWSEWGYGGADLSKAQDVFPATLSIPVILIVLFAIFKQTKKGKIKKNVFWLSIFFISIFLMLPISRKIWLSSQVLPYLQYHWRLLWLAVFSSIMIFNNIKKIPKLIYVVIILTCSYYGIFYAKPLSYVHNSDFEWMEYPGTTTSDNELLPKWFDEHANFGTDEKVLVDKGGGVDIKKWSGSSMEYDVNTLVATVAAQKTTYFPEWQVQVNNQPVQINYQHTQFPGRIVFSVSKGKHNVKVKFTNKTPARKIGITFSSIGLVLWLILLFPKIPTGDRQPSLSS